MIMFNDRGQGVSKVCGKDRYYNIHELVRIFITIFMNLRVNRERVCHAKRATNKPTEEST